MKNFENFTITDYLSIVRRRIWYLIVCTILVSVGTVLYLLQIRPSFISETTILVAGRVVPENYADSIVRDTNADRIEFVRQQLQSRTFLERIVQEFQLAGPEAGYTEGVINSVRARTQLTPLSANVFRLSFTAPDPALAQAVTRRLADRVIQLNDTSRKEKVYGTDQFMDEQLRQTGDQLANIEGKLREFYARHFPGVPSGINVDSLTTLQVQVNSLDANLQTLLDRRKTLERQIEDQRQMKALARSAAPPRAPEPETETVISLATASPVELKLAAKQADLSAASSKYTVLHPQVISLTQEVKDLEAQVAKEHARAVRPSQPRTRTPTDTRSAAIVLPEVDSSDVLQAEFRLELTRLNGNIATAEQSRRQVANKLGLYQSRINLPADLAQELNGLNRDYESANRQYADISAKKVRSGMAAEAENQVFKIVDEANLPQHGTGPNRRTLALGGCLLGFLLGIGAAFGREFLDSSLQDEDQAAAELKIAVLTSVPEVLPQEKKTFFKKHKKSLSVSPERRPSDLERNEFDLSDAESHMREVIGNPNTMAGEQFRLLRAKLSAMQKTVGLKSLIVTSAIPNEGKTFSAACLAGIMAQEPGKKVLLIDADLRTGSAGKALGVGRGSIGLTDLLRDGLLHTDDLLQRSLIKYADSQWYFLPAGALVSNPAELLSASAFERLMRQVQEQFHWVIVDSPPVLAVSDSNLLAAVCDATLFVMHAGKTPASLVKDAVKRIGPERICGLVMNRVRNLKTNQYFHSYYQKQTSGS